VTKGRRCNVAASVNERLRRLAPQRGETHQMLLIRYALERLLYRLASSKHRRHFTLKGALLFALWSGKPHRPTKDLDLLGEGSPTVERLEAVFRDVCAEPVEDDGLRFDPGSVRGERIKEDDLYDGVRLGIEARLETARVRLQVDVGFGDAVTPGVVEIAYPALLEFPAPTLRSYPRETVVAEKFQAMVALGLQNSRLKDFYDLWVLARTFEFEGVALSAALHATFRRRRTPLPVGAPKALTPEFFDDADKQTQWRAFLSRIRTESAPPALDAVATALRGFLLPPVDALNAASPFERRWPPGGLWSTRDEVRSAQ
jgi:predicted nucleotidyltransferase component of viral defense system